MSMNTIALRLAGCLLVASAGSLSLPCEAAQVGLVLDVQGEGTLETGDASKSLEMLDYLEAGSEVTLAEGARASLSVYAGRAVYQLVGPAQASLTADGLEMISGAEPVVVPMAQKLVAAAQSSDHVHGAYRMRNAPPGAIALVAPEDNSLLLQPPAAFEWEAVSAGQFDITVSRADSPSQVVARDQVTSMHWTLPASTTLAPGDYVWSVSRSSSDASADEAVEGRFSLASPQQAEQLSGLRPADDAAVEAWILYASTLQANRMHEQARDAWRRVATLRPDLSEARRRSR